MFAAVNQQPAKPAQLSSRPAKPAKSTQPTQPAQTSLPVQQTPSSSPDFGKAVEALSSAFAERPDIRDGLVSRLKSSKDLADLSFYQDLSSYVDGLRKRSTTTAGEDNAAAGPAAKKRKIEGQQIANGAPAGKGSSSGSIHGNWSGSLFEGISFTVPQRKKLALEISSKASEGIRAVNPSTKAAEFGIPRSDIAHVICLPVPEKAQASKNFCIFPHNGDGLADAGSTLEPMVWTAADTLPRGAEEGAKTQAATVLEAMKAAKMSVQEPTEKEFASEIPEPHRKGEKAYHVKAFRGSKDGYLFFLPTGILWGFKKPLIFFSFATVESVSYTSILQRTFNLNIEARSSSDVEPTEFEFSMIDQADFGGIDGYVKKHSLQDASMAEQRRAKKLNINGVRGQKDEEAQDGEEESELAKANREAEIAADDEDDEEDDDNFDPGSEGESEGSGSSDGESGDEGGGNQDDDDEDEDDDGEEEL